MFQSITLLIRNSITLLVLGAERAVSIYFSITLLTPSSITFAVPYSITLLVQTLLQERKNARITG